MAVVWAHCKTKTSCEADEPKEENAEDHEERKHGGCGHIQPQIRKEGLKLFVQYKKSKDDDEVGTCHDSFLVNKVYARKLGGQVLAARQTAVYTFRSIHDLQKDVGF